MTARKNTYSDKESIVRPMGHAQAVSLTDPGSLSPPGDDATMNPAFSFVTRGIMVNVAGAVNMVFEDDAVGDAVSIQLLAKVFYPFAVKQILFTSTTATGITVFQ